MPGGAQHANGVRDALAARAHYNSSGSQPGTEALHDRGLLDSQEEVLELSNTWVDEVLDRCSTGVRGMPLSVPAGVSAHLKLALRPKHTVLAGHVFIWSRYVQTDLKSCAFRS